jgi:hypothetical protein
MAKVYCCVFENAYEITVERQSGCRCFGKSSNINGRYIQVLDAMYGTDTTVRVAERLSQH